jgi:hypothetical protein
MRQIRESLRPGGMVFVTTPALRCFHSYNDDLVHHVRRYSKAMYAQLATDAGLELVFSRYFMFFLSPLLLLSRQKRVNLAAMSEAEKHDLLARTHKVPSSAVNGALAVVFSAETPLGISIPFPWGTSILGVFRRPA